MLTRHHQRAMSGTTARRRSVVGVLCVASVIVSCLAFCSPAHAQLPPPLLRDSDSYRTDIPEQIQDLPNISAEMQVVHRRSQLLVTRSGVVRTAIADPSVIDVVQYSPNEISVIGLAMGSTTLTLWFEDSPHPLIYLVKIIRDPSLEEQSRVDYGKLEKKIALLFPNSKVYLIPISNKIVVKGRAKDSEEAAWILSIIRGEVINQNGNLGGPQPARNIDIVDGEIRMNATDVAASNIVNMLMVPGEFQVMLRVRIAELNRSMLRQLGVNTEISIDDGRHTLATTLAGGAPTFTGIFENGDVQITIDALASNGTAKILTEPMLTVLSGHPATVLSGGEFAVPTIIGIGGAQGQQTSFRGFGTSIVVTPTVLDRDLIRMHIRPEFSEINAGNTSGGIPGLSTRRVETTVQLREGQTMVLAGLLSHRTRTEVSGIPLLKSIPYVGPLIFQRKRSTEDETELLVMVTPELVRGMDPEEVPPLPGFEVTVPDDYLLYKKAFTQGPNDTSVNQLAPYGHGSGVAVPIGYGQFNPAPADPGYAPAPTAPFGSGFSQPRGGPNGGRYPGLQQPQLGPQSQPGMQPGFPAQPGLQQPYQPGMPAPNNYNGALPGLGGQPAGQRPSTYPRTTPASPPPTNQYRLPGPTASRPIGYSQSSQSSSNAPAGTIRGGLQGPQLTFPNPQNPYGN